MRGWCHRPGQEVAWRRKSQDEVVLSLTKVVLTFLWRGLLSNCTLKTLSQRLWFWIATSQVTIRMVGNKDKNFTFQIRGLYYSPCHICVKLLFKMLTTPQQFSSNWWKSLFVYPYMALIKTAERLPSPNLLPTFRVAVFSHLESSTA